AARRALVGHRRAWLVVLPLVPVWRVRAEVEVAGHPARLLRGGGAGVHLAALRVEPRAPPPAAGRLGRGGAVARGPEDSEALIRQPLEKLGGCVVRQPVEVRVGGQQLRIVAAVLGTLAAEEQLAAALAVEQFQAAQSTPVGQPVE